MSYMYGLLAVTGWVWTPIALGLIWYFAKRNSHRGFEVVTQYHEE